MNFLSNMQKMQLPNLMEWPLYEFKSQKRVKKFWDKSKAPHSEETLCKSHMYRVGKKNKKPRQYFFRLDKMCQLSYSKKETDKNSKGVLQLTEQIQINLKTLKIKDQNELVITFEKQQRFVKKDFYCEQNELTLEWWEILTKICTINNYEEMYWPIEKVGQGNFATVFKVRRFLDDKIYAAKHYYKDLFDACTNKERYISMLKNETLILRILSHPNIVQIHEVYQQPDKIVIIMDYVSGCDLYKLLKDNKRLTEKQAAIILYRLADALSHVSKYQNILIDRNEFCHRDIKLENILISDPGSLQIKLVDFGFAERIDSSKLRSKAGTPGYIPPEVFRAQPYTAKGDVFSAGVVVYSLICGYSPFRGATYEKVMICNKRAVLEFNRQFWDTISQPCKDLISRMLSVDPAQRISVEEVLEHEWMKQQLGDDLGQLFMIENDLKFPAFGARDEYEMMIGGQIRSLFMKSNYAQSGRSMRSIKKQVKSQQNHDEVLQNQFAASSDGVFRPTGDGRKAVSMYSDMDNQILDMLDDRKIDQRVVDFLTKTEGLMSKLQNLREKPDDFQLKYTNQ